MIGWSHQSLSPQVRPMLRATRTGEPRVAGGAARKNLIEPASHKRCRFKYPRKRQRKASVAVRGGGGKRAYIALRRQHPWVNTYNPHIMLAWRGNIDIQFIADPGAVLC